ncbi:MAG: M48 family metallopeptidase [Mobilitalea sp.]
MKHIIISNIPIEFEKKRIKNMYLRILPPDGRVHISAPVRMSEDEIKRFVESKLEWIELQQRKIQQRHTHQEMQYVSGEEVYVWGRKFNLIVLETAARHKLNFDGENIIVHVKVDSSTEQRAKVMNYWLREALQQEIPALIAKWESIIGVKSNDWTIRDMKTRWGTCNIRSKKICLNLQLAKKPPKCLEYVVIHELVHLLEKSHNSVFKGYMDRFLPQWRSIKKELNGME